MTTAMNEAEKLAGAITDYSRHGHETEQAAKLRRMIAHTNAAALIRRQAEQIKVLRSALEEAASSLTYIANTACKRNEELMSDAINVRGYARSRASVAEAALAATKEET